MQQENKTPFVFSPLVVLDKQAAEHLVLALKASFDISADGRLTPTTPQEPFHPADVFLGEPGQSSIRREAELTPPKPATDVVLLGSAYAPGGRARSMEVSLDVGGLHKRARVFGERHWTGLGWLRVATSPKPFDKLPLIWEHAYGGRDKSPRSEKRHSQEPRNPVGRGFRARRSRLPWRGEPLPNIEVPDQSYSRPGKGVQPAGFGFVGRDWLPRLSFIGTYDAQWMEERMPLLPLDFDERYHNSVPGDQTVKGRLKGDEAVEVLGCTPSGHLAFKLPSLKPTGFVKLDGLRQPVALELDTVLIDLDLMRLSLLWKGSQRVHGKLPRVDMVGCSVEEPHR